MITDDGSKRQFRYEIRLQSHNRVSLLDEFQMNFDAEFTIVLMLRGRFEFNLKMSWVLIAHDIYGPSVMVVFASLFLETAYSLYFFG